MATCSHCDIERWEDHAGYGHDGLCCNCFDLSCGQPLEDINEERAAAGRAPITKPWPKVKHEP